MNRDLKQRARRAYELQMLWAGVLRLWPLALVVPAALALHGAAANTPWRTGVAAVLLGATLLVTGWRGGGWRRGALPGLLGGLPAFFVPSLIMPASATCERCVHASAHWLTCMTACTFASLVAGLALAHLARRDRAPRSFAASAALTAGLTASLTCSLAGYAGVVGVALGLGLASAPILVLGRRVAA